jgi:hypothetical protein
MERVFFYHTRADYGESKRRKPPDAKGKEKMEFHFDAVYFEPEALRYELGRELRSRYAHLPWTAIESHNKIPSFTNAENRCFPQLKRHLVVGVRKTHRYTENHKVSDYLVPYTSSGCRAMCLYCYLVCNYNKCSYLRGLRQSGADDAEAAEDRQGVSQASDV